MMTRRSSFFALAGLVSGILVTGAFSLPGPVSAQPTETETQPKARKSRKTTAAQWDSLSPDQQQQLQEKWQLTAEEAEVKWSSMTPRQQKQAMAKGKKAAQKAPKQSQSPPQ